MRNLFTNTRGATAIEYGLIAALIAVAIVGAMSGLGTKFANKPAAEASSPPGK